MAMQIRLFATLRQVVGKAAVEVPRAEGDTLGTLLARLVKLHPDLGPELLDGDGQLQTHIHLMLNGRDVRFLDGLDTPVQASDQMCIFPPVGGGSLKGIQPPGEPADSPSPGPTA